MTLTELHSLFLKHPSICTDTRKLKQGDLFFALKGDNFNGNLFAQQALDKGASYAVIDEKLEEDNNERTILVSDVLKTLQDLSTYHREHLGLKIIALTGSNGKTTTKELINATLSTRYRTVATKGNLNNHIGVPLTLLSMNEHTEIGIVEMGANHQKEIAFLCSIVKPDFGLITNFGKAHLEGFGGIEGVIKGKSELYDYLKSNNKTAFINRDDLKQVEQIGDYYKIVTFGANAGNDCSVVFERANPFVSLKYNGKQISSQLIGDYNYGNIAVAIAIGKFFEIPAIDIKNAIENYQPDNNRSEIIEKGKTTIILDAYNANPTSMLAALKNFIQLDAEHKYLFLGDMFELGDEAEKEHQAIADFVESNFEKNIHLIGENFFETKAKKTTNIFSSFETLIPKLENLEIEEDATILIKGSRGMALERIVEFL